MQKIFWIQFIVIVAENIINFKVQHQCPQCGAPAILEEETLFFVCEFCRVRSCISQKGFFRYVFSPHKQIPEDQPLIYIPYWRFKGVQFTCLLKGVDYKFLDISCIAMQHKPPDIPFSLGFRSQALTLKLISSKTRGTFLRPWAFKQTLINMNKQTRPRNTFFQENIGETVSLIYSPFYKKENLLFDGILNKPIGTDADNSINVEPSHICRPEKEISFIPGLCPSCGWNFDGSFDSLVMVCRNCGTLWRTRGSKLVKIKFGCAEPNSEKDVLLPFWKINADISLIDLRFYSDLIQFANLPKVPNPDFNKQVISFWAPAFKIRPKIFLRLITQLAILQPGDDDKSSLGTHKLSTVNLLQRRLNL